jgi:hypothetical protein
MTIHEPATLLTDYLLALLGGYLAWRLHRHPSIETPAVRWWFRALVVLAVSAFVGGSYHGFAPNLPRVVDDLWWRVVLWIICLLGYAMGSALVCEMVPRAAQRTWSHLLIAKFLIASVFVILVPEFFVAIADYGLVMLAWGVVAVFVDRPWRGWLLAAVALSAIAAWVQQREVSLSRYLNHNDVFHLIQALALIGLFRGARLMRGSSGTRRDPAAGATSEIAES